MAPSYTLQSLRQRRRRRHRRAAAVVVTLAAAATAFYYQSNFEKQVQHDSILSGRKWMEELLQGNPHRIRDNLGMTKDGFYYIENLLKSKTPFANTRYMDTVEQLGIFLYAITTDISMRKLAERFQRSTETIQRTKTRKLS